MGYTYSFDEGSREQRDLLGSKGANLAEMANLGLPVPPGFVITTEACRAYLEHDRVPDGLEEEVDERLGAVEEAMGRRLGDPEAPLLLSVRSGAPVSMPGMMDTILNVGLSDDTVAGLAARTGDERFALDAYRRLVAMFGEIVLGVAGDRFQAALADAVERAGAGDETQLAADHLHDVLAAAKAIVEEDTGNAFPQDPREQLRQAIEAVFGSWNTERARSYRAMEGIPDELGTAVNVQAMAFGNLGQDSATGVAFTRDPSTGRPEPYGDWLRNAQGEDVVAGTRVTEDLASLGEAMPDVHGELLDVLARLERHYRDLCDVEFTIERGRLWILQTRSGKRSAQASLRIAADMVHEGLIDREEALRRVSPDDLGRLLHPQFDPDADYDAATTGLAASPGAASGRVCFDAADAQERAAAGDAVILVRPETSPDDLDGMVAARGVLTSRGGLVSHAAIVARSIGKPAVCGAEAVDVDAEAGRFTVDGTEVGAGDLISISGTTGEVVLGEVPVVEPDPGEAFTTVLGWADEIRRLGVRANADTPDDARRARALGAEGIGLCRTEHLFLGERLPLIRRFMLAADADEERKALAALEERQRGDFADLLEAMDGLPVTVRLLDPPLHEFLPDVGELAERHARGELDDDERELLEAARRWQEANPMLGTRGVRLGVRKPELYRMQARALATAAAERTNAGGDPHVEIMIPLVITGAELAAVAGWVRDAFDDALDGTDVVCRIGTMVETPRAALAAGDIARSAAFFSFGTNDLTQMTLGLSRDDVEGALLDAYLEQGLLDANPFETLDVAGVGRLIRWAADEGRSARADLVLGICGEHGGDPASVAFCHDVRLDYVSCSPYRVPPARLAAAHAALNRKEG